MIKKLSIWFLNVKIKLKTNKAKLEATKFEKKVMVIKNNPKRKKKFTAGEIACSLFNCDLALKNLSDEKFNLVMDVYEGYLFSKRKLKLNYSEFTEYCAKIINDYSAVAPYEKISGFNENI